MQFGINYGVANKTGQVPVDEIQKIISLCAKHGIDTIDTAIAYGDSETRLGEAGVDDFNIITKLPDYSEGAANPESWLDGQISNSLKRLGVPRLNGCLFHHPDQLSSATGELLYQSLVTLKSSGLVDKIGVSIYSPEQLDSLMKHFDFDMVQAPFNIVDRRLMNTGWIGTLQQKKVEIHTRSVFLQGLLLMSDKERSPYFNKWENLWRNWREWLEVSGLSPLQACLGYVYSVPGIDKIVVGIDSARQLEQILDSIPTKKIEYPDVFSLDEKKLVEPSNWPDFSN